MNISKFLQGAAIPAYVHYTPVVTSDSRVSASTAGSTSGEKESSSKKNEGLTDKDLLKALDSLDALPNEVREITSEIQNFILDLSVLASADPTQLSLQYASLIGKMKIAKFNSELFKNSYDQIKSNGGLTAIAIDTDGYIFCRNVKNPDDFERLTPELYMANRDTYVALTNLQLLDLRAQAPELVDKNEIFRIVSNGVGMPAILDLINKSITKIGTTTLQEQGYSLTQLALIARGLEYIEQASGNEAVDKMSVDGIYNLGVLSKDLKLLAQMALNYLYATLPKNAKTYLEVLAAENGIKGGALGLITNLIQSKLDITHTEKLQRSNNPGTKGKTSKTTEVPEGIDPLFAKLSLTPVMLAQLGLGERKLININVGNAYNQLNYGLVVPIVSKSGEAIGANSTLLEVSLSLLAGALEIDNATLGGARIDPASIRKIAITNGDAYIINVPIDKNRNDGVIAPDLRYLNRLKEADQEIEAWKQTHRSEEITSEIINDIYKKHKLPVLMDQNGELNVRDYGKFAVFNGETKDAYLIPPPDGSDIMAQDISTDSNIRNYKDILSGNKETKVQEDFDEDNWYDWNGHDTLYRGTIFIPLKSNILSGAATSGTNLTVSEAMGIQARDDQRKRTANYLDGSSRFGE